MPKKHAYDRGAKLERTRRGRKLRWIRAKNLMSKYSDCSYNGDFYCDHMYDPAHPWVWVDFRFFHTRLKRYFAVAMTTLEYHAVEENDNAAYLKVCEEVGELKHGSMVKTLHPKYGSCYVHQLTDEDREFNSKHIERQVAVAKEMNALPVIIKPRVEVRDYGKVAVGVMARVNTPFIDEHYIRKFIQWYREMGEPTTPGWIWEGDEVEVIPENINRRTENA